MAIYNSQGNVIGHNNLGQITYETDFFAGSQVCVHIGDVVVDTARAVSFVVSQNKTPVYGYANQYYSFMAAGQVIVQGELLINFKETGYLLNALARYNRLSAQNLPTTPRHGAGRQYDTFMSAAKSAARKKQATKNIEQMLGFSEQNQTNRDLTLYNQAWRELEALPDDAFEDWAERFEDAIWYGSDTSNPYLRDKLYAKNIEKGSEITPEDVLSYRRADLFPSVDIWIVYGDMAHKGVNHTTKKIMDVEFTSQGQQIEVEGEILESYSFLAKNLV